MNQLSHFYIKTPLKGEAIIEFVEQRYINMAFWISGGALCGKKRLASGR